MLLISIDTLRPDHLGGYGYLRHADAEGPRASGRPLRRRDPGRRRRAGTFEAARRFSPANTLVVLTSDHGEEFLEHGGLTHGSALYDEALRVPLIVAGPGVSKGHRVLPSAAVDGPSATEREVLRALGYQ